MKKPRAGWTLLLLAACTATTRPAPQGPLFPDADPLQVVEIAPGVSHTRIHHAAGPWAIHVVTVDPRQCAPVLRARKPGSVLADRATTSAIAGSALAAINADFFMLPGGTPVGAHVEEGIPLTGPVDRQVFAVTSDGYEIGRGHVRGHARTRGDSVSIAQINRAAAPFSAYSGTRDGVTLITKWMGDSIPADSATLRITLTDVSGNEAAGRGVVAGTASPAARAALQPGTIVLHAHGSAHAWAQRRARGDTVTWQADVRVSGRAPATEAVGGFPELIRGGRDVLGEQTVRPDFGSARHPRTAVGWTTAGELLLVVVDGRQPGYSAGMTLDELTWLFHRLGATDALNLDGGGSTALVVRGTVVNRPSDREGERPVGNALVLERCR